MLRENWTCGVYIYIHTHTILSSITNKVGRRCVIIKREWEHLHLNCNLKLGMTIFVTYHCLLLLTRQDTSQVNPTTKLVCGVGKCSQVGHIPWISQMFFFYKKKPWYTLLTKLNRIDVVWVKIQGVVYACIFCLNVRARNKIISFIKLM